MNSEENKSEAVEKDTDPTLDRRKLMVAGGAGLAGSLMAGLGAQRAVAWTSTSGMQTGGAGMTAKALGQ